MMSYTMLCTSLWESAGMLTRFMSPSTRIIGGHARRKMQIRRVILDGKRQQLGDIQGHECSTDLPQKYSSAQRPSLC